MDRQIVWPGAIPLETDLLNTNRSAMIALGMLAQDLLGSDTLVSGFTCAPTSPGSLAVNVAAGRIYSLANIDGTAYSSLAADTAHSLIKQGIALDATQLSLAAPSTSGMSVNYLIEAAFSEVDADAVVLPYYNASNPANPYLGPNNSGSSQYTQRQGTVVLTAKAGVAATTGSQTTPPPDSGNVGLWVVTVANGQSAITTSNIAQYNGGAAWIQNTLNLLAPLASPALTGYPTAPTPAQFDDSTKIATTNFVQSALGNLVGTTILSATTTLTAAYCGRLIIYTGATGIFTLPPSASCAQGAQIRVMCHIGNLTIAPAGSDALGLPDSTSGKPFTMVQGDTVEFTLNGTAWWATGGVSAEVLAASSGFKAILANTGYQKLPSGLIVQWGAFTGSATGAVSVTFPVTFPNACYSIAFGPNDNIAMREMIAAQWESLNTSGFTAAIIKLVSGSSTTFYNPSIATYIAVGE